MVKNPMAKAVDELFDAQYIVPIYQRNYAWTEVEIIQLIEDIQSTIQSKHDTYFLGNLIVDQRDTKAFEVIDGQQRLTTIYLLKRYLNVPLSLNALTFEAREKSNRTLRYIRDDARSALVEDLLTPEIIAGYETIAHYFETKQLDPQAFIKKLAQVYLVHVQVPANSDLNHYFEIMNTRGEQLELHEVAKAKLLEALETDEDRQAAAQVWEACADMTTYLQMSFHTAVRDDIFTPEWSQVHSDITDFQSLQERIATENKDLKTKSLRDILEEDKLVKVEPIDNETSGHRFESTISFRDFLLQVHAVMRKSEGEAATLDDNNFLESLSWHWATQKRAEDFVYHLFTLRFLFDQYIVKREYGHEDQLSGHWSLQRLTRYRNQPQYVATLSDEVGRRNQQLRTLQASLRITYTSPKTMHWITVALTHALETKPEQIDLIRILEDYAVKQVKASNYESASGFEFERIVFTYLDYLLYRDGYTYQGTKIISPMRESWPVPFRNSIEHFHPQHPVEGRRWDDDSLNQFGNLALMTVSGNSRFSNLPPESKISAYPSLMAQSGKLKVMKAMTAQSDGKWTEEKMQTHEAEMFRLLREAEASHLE